MAVPSSDWSELTPTDSTLISAVDNLITALKTQVREIIAVDHKIASSGQDTDWGYHNKVTLLEQINPSAVTDAIIAYTQETSGKAELYLKFATPLVVQMTSGNNWVGGMTSEIRMFYGLLSEIPSGWQLATAMIGKLIRGINTTVTEPGTTGGSDSVTLTSANLPAHIHTTTTDAPSTNGIHIHRTNSFSGGTTPLVGLHVTGSLAFSTSSTAYSTTDGAHSHIISTTGTNPTIDNRPAYYELAFLTRI